MLGAPDVHMQKNEIRSLSYTTYKNYLEIDQDLNGRTETLKLLEEKRNKLLDTGLAYNFLDDTSITKIKIKSKNQ